MSLRDLNQTKWSEKELNDIIEQFGADSQKVWLYCSTHEYYGPGDKNKTIPTVRGCSKCILVYLLVNYMNTPPHERGEYLDNLERLVRGMVQDAEQGKFSIKLYDHPEIDIQKEN